MKKFLLIVFVMVLVLTLISCATPKMNISVGEDTQEDENDISETDDGSGWPEELPVHVPKPIDVSSFNVMTIEDEIIVSFTGCTEDKEMEYVAQLEAAGWEIVSSEDQEGTYVTTAQDAQGNILTFSREGDGDYGSIDYISKENNSETEDGTGWPEELPDNVPKPIDVSSFNVMTIEDEIIVSFTGCTEDKEMEYVAQLEAAGWEIVSSEDQEGTHVITTQDALGNILTFSREGDGDYGSIDYIAKKYVSGDDDAWPDDFPDNVPKPIGVSYIDVMPVEGRTTVGFEGCTSDKAEEYVAQLEAAGWEIVNTEDQEGTHLYTAQDAQGNTLSFSWEEDGDLGFIGYPANE